MLGQPVAPWQRELAVLHLIALALVVIVARAWGRHEGRGRLVNSGLLTVLAILLLYSLAVDPRDIPVDWITILHHGLGRKSIMHLYGRGAHGGPNFVAVLSAVAPSGPNLHFVVWLNLLLALINAAVFAHVAYRITGPLWAVVWTLIFALNPATFQASFSELPTGVLSAYFLAGVIGWAVLTDPLPHTWYTRAAGFALCALVTLFTGLTRAELALTGVVALGVYTAHAIVGAERWTTAGEHLRAVGGRMVAYFGDRPKTVVVLCILGWWFAMAGVPGLIGRAEIAGVYPFNPSIFSLFFFLPMLALPIGASIATFFGFIHSLMNIRQLGGLALSLLFLVRAYFAAQYHYYEMARYLSYVFPAIFLLGLFGQGAMHGLAERLRPGWRRAATIVYLMAWFTYPMPGTPEFFMRPEYHRAAGFSQLMLDLNTQREERYLVSLMEKNPECVFVARVIYDQGDPKENTQYSYMLFGAPVSHPVLVPEQGTRLDELIARHTPAGACVRLYYGGDCNLNFADGCKEFVAGRRRIDEYRFWSRPYNNPIQSGFGAPEIVLAVYAWP